MGMMRMGRRRRRIRQIHSRGNQVYWACSRPFWQRPRFQGYHGLYWNEQGCGVQKALIRLDRYQAF
jgi:hypothetical protein